MSSYPSSQTSHCSGLLPLPQAPWDHWGTFLLIFASRQKIERVRELQPEEPEPGLPRGVYPQSEREDGLLTKRGIDSLYLAHCFFSYMSEVVCLQRPVGTERIQEKTKHPPPCPPKPCSPGHPGPQIQPRHAPGKGPPGSGEAAALQEMRSLPASVGKTTGGTCGWP